MDERSWFEQVNALLMKKARKKTLLLFMPLMIKKKNQPCIKTQGMIPPRCIVLLHVQPLQIILIGCLNLSSRR